MRNITISLTRRHTYQPYCHREATATAELDPADDIHTALVTLHDQVSDVLHLPTFLEERCARVLNPVDKAWRELYEQRSIVGETVRRVRWHIAQGSFQLAEERLELLRLECQTAKDRWLLAHQGEKRTGVEEARRLAARSRPEPLFEGERYEAAHDLDLVEEPS